MKKKYFFMTKMYEAFETIETIEEISPVTGSGDMEARKKKFNFYI